MATDLAAPPFDIAAFAARIGVSESRVVRTPAPGTATEDDVTLRNDVKDGPLCELIDGTLVEKVMGAPEATFMMYFGELLNAFIRTRRLGWASGPDGMNRLITGRVRMPDIGFLARASVPGGRRPDTLIFDIAPDLSIEMLSRVNTRREMLEKRRDLFGSGTKLVWEVHVGRRTVTVYTAPEAATVLTAAAGDTLNGGDVLPGFTLALADLFAEYDADA